MTLGLLEYMVSMVNHKSWETICDRQRMTIFFIEFKLKEHDKFVPIQHMWGLSPEMVSSSREASDWD